MPKAIPHEKRQGRLNNGNPPGDFTRAARCGAKTRRGTPCQCPAMGNGRCRLHGGLSTGPKTAEGIERIRRAVTKHGNYSKRTKAEKAEYRELLQSCREMLAGLSCNGTVE
ncbi:MAG: HGGxSTG domain-containing protein [Bryobacteraceae bacterium]